MGNDRSNTLDLFALPTGDGVAVAPLPVPLAEALRPQSFDDVVGQSHLIGPGRFLTQLVQSDQIPSLIFWGPPGTGKTTLAHLIAKSVAAEFAVLSAVTSSIKDVKAVVEAATRRRQCGGGRTLLFVDEIHRFNKAQQDAFLPHVEKGTITLVGATTENPSFEVIPALLSRCRVLVLSPLAEADLDLLACRALQRHHRHPQTGLVPEARALLLRACEGDARRLLNVLETAVALSPESTITLAHIETALQKKALAYDKSGEGHYNLVSAFIKSMRGTSPDAAVYYLARMLEAGEDPLFTARRMVIFASEDVGNADPQALVVATSAMAAFRAVGMPEGWIPLAQAATYLASAPKSNASYKAYLAAKAEIAQSGDLPVPLHLRNAPTQLMKSLDYGNGYLYPHDFEEAIARQWYLPDALADRRFYYPTENGQEAAIKDHLDRVAKRRLSSAAKKTEKT